MKIRIITHSQPRLVSSWASESYTRITFQILWRMSSPHWDRSSQKKLHHEPVFLQYHLFSGIGTEKLWKMSSSFSPNYKSELELKKAQDINSCHIYRVNQGIKGTPLPSACMAQKGRILPMEHPQLFMSTTQTQTERSFTGYPPQIPNKSKKPYYEARVLPLPKQLGTCFQRLHLISLKNKQGSQQKAKCAVHTASYRA